MDTVTHIETLDKEHACVASSQLKRREAAHRKFKRLRLGFASARMPRSLRVIRVLANKPHGHGFRMQDLLVPGAGMIYVRSHVCSENMV